jgi:hypothetical protein
LRALGYSIYTEAENLEKLRDAVKAAVKCHFGEKDLPLSSDYIW